MGKEQEIEEFVKNNDTAEILDKIRWSRRSLHVVVSKAMLLRNAEFWGEVNPSQAKKIGEAIDGAEEAARRQERDQHVDALRKMGYEVDIKDRGEGGESDKGGKGKKKQ